MTLSVIIEFQKNLQQIMDQDEILSNIVKDIFYIAKPATKYPYIYHKANNAKLINHDSGIYEIEGEINCYIRDHSLRNFLIIIKRVEAIFRILSEFITTYKYISGSLGEAEFDMSHDQLTSRMKLGYNVLINTNI